MMSSGSRVPVALNEASRSPRPTGSVRNGSSGRPEAREYQKPKPAAPRDARTATRVTNLRMRKPPAAGATFRPAPRDAPVRERGPLPEGYWRTGQETLQPSKIFPAAGSETGSCVGEGVWKEGRLSA